MLLTHFRLSHLGGGDAVKFGVETINRSRVEKFKISLELINKKCNKRFFLTEAKVKIRKLILKCYNTCCYKMYTDINFYSKANQSQQRLQDMNDYD